MLGYAPDAYTQLHAEEAKRKEIGAHSGKEASKMMQTEDGKLTLEDKRELSIQIKELELKVQKQRDYDEPAWEITMKQLRKLRRQRDAR